MQYMHDISHRNIEVLEDFLGTKVYMQHKCLVCTHVWKAKPNTILNGHGCPSCNTGGAPASREPSSLYLLRISTNQLRFLKVGYSKNVPSRMRGIKSDIKLHTDNAVSVDLLDKIEAMGDIIWNLEQRIHRKKKGLGLTQFLDASVIFNGFSEYYCYKDLDKLQSIFTEYKKELNNGIHSII